MAYQDYLTIMQTIQMMNLTMDLYQHYFRGDLTMNWMINGTMNWTTNVMTDLMKSMNSLKVKTVKVRSLVRTLL